MEKDKMKSGKRLAEGIVSLLFVAILWMLNYYRYFGWPSYVKIAIPFILLILFLHIFRSLSSGDPELEKAFKTGSRENRKPRLIIIRTIWIALAVIILIYISGHTRHISYLWVAFIIALYLAGFFLFSYIVRSFFKYDDDSE